MATKNERIKQYFLMAKPWEQAEIYQYFYELTDRRTLWDMDEWRDAKIIFDDAKSLPVDPSEFDTRDKFFYTGKDGIIRSCNFIEDGIDLDDMVTFAVEENEPLGNMEIDYILNDEDDED